MNTTMAQLYRLYGPSVASMTDNLGDLGQSLHFAFNALATDCTVTGIDELVSRLKTAEQTLTRLRLALIEREGNG
jgi:hypothetical protein